jgi:ribose-phosphate pyrophosphokinase
MVGDIVQAAGVEHVITIDLHAPQIEGFFRIPVDSLTAVPILSGAVRPARPESTAVLAPDAGRVRMATDMPGGWAFLWWSCTSVGKAAPERP